MYWPEKYVNLNSLTYRERATDKKYLLDIIIVKGLSKNKNPSMVQGQMYSLFSHSSFSAIIFNCSQSITYYIVPRSIINPLCNIVSYITCFTAWRVFQVKFCMGMYHWFVWAGPLTWMKSIPICQAEADAKFSCCFKRIIYRNRGLNS